jgi:hypothetical protein
MTADEWINQFASALGVATPAEEDIAVLLELAGIAAHASERVSAPVSCWLVARSGLPPIEAFMLAQRLAVDIAQADDRGVC